MSAVRDRIRSHVADHPGVHFNAVVRDLDLAAGQVQYHLRRLLTDEALVADSYYGRTHYFPPEYDAWERAALALARRETARDVVFFLLDEGPSAPATVAESVGVARSTLEHHVDHLVEHDLVEKRRDRHNHVTLAVVEREAAARVLDEVRPSLPDRFVDRFERLVDALLD